MMTITFKEYAQKLLADYREWASNPHTPNQLMDAKQVTQQLLAQAQLITLQERYVGVNIHTDSPS